MPLVVVSTCLAGVEVPEVETLGFLLSDVPVAAAARSAEAWDRPGGGTGVPCTAEAPDEVAFKARADTDERLLEDRCRREAVGCVGPVIWCAGFGSAGSTGTVDGVAEEAEVTLWLETTEAEFCARRTESSRVRRLT